MKIDKNRLQVIVGGIAIGGGAPTVVQSMTNTDTANRESTVNQVNELWKAGSELVRITVNNEEAAREVYGIKQDLLAMGCNGPLIGDFHCNGHKLLQKFSE